MPKLFEIEFAGGCKSLPDGFWSAVDVWIKKPHVVNKRLCGVKETESRDVGREDLLFLLEGDEDEELLNHVMLFLCSVSPARSHQGDKPWTSSVRTFIPKVDRYGAKQHKELILKGKSGLKSPYLLSFIRF